jgi:hypothetical protein
MSHYPSQQIGRVLQLLLGIGLALFALVAGFTAVYAGAYDFYLSYLSTIDTAISTFGTILYYICVVLFLIWIVKVHAALRQQFMDYPIHATGAIVRMLPLIQIWGIGSTFSTISGYFYARQQTHPEARRIQRLIVPLYCVIFIGNAMNRWVSGASYSESLDTLILIASVLDVLSMLVFYALARAINNGLTTLFANRTEASERLPETAEPNTTSAI